MTTVIKTRKDLDEALEQGCNEPGCIHEHAKMSELYIAGKCHPGYGVDIRYNVEGVLIVTCHVCEREIAAIKVGGEE